MSRSIWKGPYVDPSLRFSLHEKGIFYSDIEHELKTKDLTKIELLRKYGVPIYSRNSTILPEFLNKILLIHTGNDFFPLIVQKEHVGLKFGSLAPTKKFPVYKKKKKKLYLRKYYKYFKFLFIKLNVFCV